MLIISRLLTSFNFRARTGELSVDLFFRVLFDRFLLLFVFFFFLLNQALLCGTTDIFLAVLVGTKVLTLVGSLSEDDIAIVSEVALGYDV